ncbi:MAG TPA: rhodanese-like domain-containing protein [Pyrinomonadaceae bacterium]|nr:rhodanese-like domain-containing protein [Pyrinomonadaceae bacterium]
MKTSNFSFVMETAAGDPEIAKKYFATKLNLETDAWDVKTDMERGHDGFIVVDTRSREDFEARHIAGAISLPHRSINEETTAHLPKDKVLITYCWSPGCNGSTKGALRLSALGFRVKEMIGGLEYWMRERGLVEGTLEGEESGAHHAAAVSK